MKGEPGTIHGSVNHRVQAQSCQWRQLHKAATFYAWKSKHGGLELSEARRLRGLEEENAKLKRLLAEVMHDNVGLKHLLGKNGDPA